MIGKGVMRVGLAVSVRARGRIGLIGRTHRLTHFESRHKNMSLADFSGFGASLSGNDDLKAGLISHAQLFFIMSLFLSLPMSTKYFKLTFSGIRSTLTRCGLGKSLG